MKDASTNEDHNTFFLNVLLKAKLYLSLYTNACIVNFIYF